MVPPLGGACHANNKANHPSPEPYTKLTLTTPLSLFPSDNTFMSLPDTYTHELNTLNRQVLENKPDDILQFCANYFNRRLESQRVEHLLSLQDQSSSAKSSRNAPMSASTFPGNNPFGSSSSFAFGGRKDSPSRNMQRLDEEEENDILASPTNHKFRNNMINHSSTQSQEEVSSFQFGGDGIFEGPFGGTSFLNPAGTSGTLPQGATGGLPSNYALGRRTSVSAESMNPTSQSNGTWNPPSHPKTQEQLSRLKSAVATNFLFSHLDDEQFHQILGALVEKPIPAKDIKVIIQGDAGDFFYVVERGQFDVYVNPAGSIQAGSDGMGNKVASIGPGGSFGELALMYNAPRAATVISTEPNCTLWALDRVTFRRILMDSAFTRRRMYEQFLSEVPLLSSLESYERSKIADALDTQKFPAGTIIIRQGDPGDSFFILESGEAEVFKLGTENPVKVYRKGDYFGELALLNDQPRAASVVSKTEVKVAKLGKAGFQRLLGPVEGIMRRNDYAVDPLSQ
ncbi:MAG: hypothetical protein M1834_001391 [Cirrosporium novae-zelandiae]|nr:MAG: hypothetical protein M1834_001391 [Cirrosporium novae-zelandiae]